MTLNAETFTDLHQFIINSINVEQLVDSKERSR